MALTGQLIIENFGWSDPEDIEFPGVDAQTGQMTGAVLKRRVFRVQALDSGVVVEFRVAPEDWDKFTNSLAGRKVHLASAAEAAQLRRLPPARNNGGG